MGTNSFGSAFATAAADRKPLSQNTLLSVKQVSGECRRKEKSTTHAVLLFTNVILASDSRSALAPALSRSEKWSRAADNALSPRQFLTLDGMKAECGDATSDIPPSHDFAELDHAGGETLRCLREDLHRPAGHVVGPRDGVDGPLVA